MSLPFRRRSRPRGQARLALTGDFPGTDHDITEAIQAIPPAPWHGTTVPLQALRGQPRYAPAEDWELAEIEAHITPPAAVLRMPQARAVMTVNPPGPGVPGPTQQALEVARFLRAKVTILKRRGQLDRISQEKLAMLPADRIRNRRTTARLIVDEAAELLRCGGDPR
jgi:hypothetical protein